MSDNELDAELLALAGDDSASETETTKPARAATKSQSPEPVSTASASKPRAPRAQKGVAQRKTIKPARTTAAKRKAKDESEEEGQASSAESLGSGAMDESESDTSPDANGHVDDKIHYPIEGKFASEKDRAEIMAMPELQREQKLADRAAEIARQKQDETLRQLRESRQQLATQTAEVFKKRKAAVADLDETPRKVTKAKVKANDNLENYKRQREQRADQRRRNEDNRKDDKRSPSPNGLSDADGEGNSDVEWADSKPKKAPVVKAEPQAELRDFERIRVGRSNFAKVCFYPGFEDAIKGCFCRVSIGPDKTTGQNVYRMTQIKGFTTGRLYSMEGPNGRPIQTDLYAVVAHGKAEKEWPFMVCSDSRFTEAEFDRYKKAIATDSLRLPVLSYLSAKCDGIHALLNRTWTAEQIEEKLRRSGVVATQHGVQVRERLIDARKTAVEDGDEAAIARIDQEIATLDGPKINYGGPVVPLKAPAPKVPTQQDRLAALNRANRKANQEEIRKAQLAEKKREQKLQEAVMRGEAVANPFARVKTRAKVVYDVTPTAKAVDDLFGEASDISRAATPVPPLAAAATKNGVGVVKTGPASLARQKKMDDEIMASMDLGIEIDI